MVFSFLFLGFGTIIQANRIYVKRLRRQMSSEGKRSALQDRVLLQIPLILETCFYYIFVSFYKLQHHLLHFQPLSDFQKAQWLNQAIEKMWPQFLEKVISQDILGPMVPWFLDKFKPGTVVRFFTLRTLNWFLFSLNIIRDPIWERKEDNCLLRGQNGL